MTNSDRVGSTVRIKFVIPCLGNGKWSERTFWRHITFCRYDFRAKQGSVAHVSNDVTVFVSQLRIPGVCFSKQIPRSNHVVGLWLILILNCITVVYFFVDQRLQVNQSITHKSKLNKMLFVLGYFDPNCSNEIN